MGREGAERGERDGAEKGGDWVFGEQGEKDSREATKWILVMWGEEGRVVLFIHFDFSFMCLCILMCTYF